MLHAGGVRPYIKYGGGGEEGGGGGDGGCGGLGHEDTSSSTNGSPCMMSRGSKPLLMSRTWVAFATEWYKYRSLIYPWNGTCGNF